MNAHAVFSLPPADASAPLPAPIIPADHRLSQPTIVGGTLMADLILLSGAACAAIALTDTPLDWGTGLASLALVAAIPLILHQMFGYTITALASARRQALRVAGAMVGALALVSLALVATGTGLEDNRPWLGTFAVLASMGLVASRLALRAAINHWTEQGRLARRAVIVGGGAPVESLLASLKKDSSNAIQILGLFDDRGQDRSPDTVDDYHKLGGFDEMTAFCRAHNVDLIIITLPHTAEQRILYLLKKLWVLPIDVRISAVTSKLKLRPRAYSYIGRTPILAVFDKPLTDWGQAVKALEDRVLAALLLVALSPVMLAVALAVKFGSKGPILFKQTRYGFNNEKIGVYKFRSMYVDQCDANANRLVTKGDPRVTRVGAIIRKTSLDELPQLFNVLKGELSIVGPRPHAMQAKADGHIYDEVVEGYFARHRVKPGITGWAQINGWRGETDTVDKIERRVEYDIQYIDNWSVFFDLYILAMTPVSLLNTKNAY